MNQTDHDQKARELAETLDALADDTRGHSLNGQQHDHLREAAAALRTAPEGFVLVSARSVEPCGCGCHRHCCRSCGEELGGLARPQEVE